MALSIGFRIFSFLPSCYSSYGALTFTPVGLSPTVHASLRWTHTSSLCQPFASAPYIASSRLNTVAGAFCTSNVTFHPTGDWIVQQLREAFPLPCPYRYVLFDHDAKFGNDVLKFLKSSDLMPLRTSVRSPWQNGVAERWVGSVRRELLDQVIPLNEFHLGRLGREYLAYYHQDRTHVGLEKNTPDKRVVEGRSSLQSRVVSKSRLGGLHHRYSWLEAA